MPGLTRRRFGPLALGIGALPFAAGAAGRAEASSVVRVALVNTPDDLLRELAPDFETQSGQRVEIAYVGDEPYEEARAGRADLVISHYGHHGAEPFMLEGLGHWPHMVFANQQVLVGPPGDPAGVRGLADAAEALRRIALAGAPYVANNASGITYLFDLLWHAAGQPKRDGWYVDLGQQGRPAMETAAQRAGYAFWGLVPFLRSQRQRPLDLEVLVDADPLFQRVMVAIVVRPDRVAGVNAEGAAALQRYLIAPATQARISAFRYPELDRKAWWPAGRHNSAAGRE